MKTHRYIAALAALVILTTLAPAQAPAAPTTPAGPADAAGLNQRSIDLLQQNDAKEAVELAKQATLADPTKAGYFSQLGIALSQRMNEVPFMQMAVMSGQLRKAFQKSVELDPDHIPGLIGLARFYTNAPEIAGGSLEKAAEFAKRVQALNPFLGEIELARVAEKAENFADALAHYEAAAQLKPDKAGLQFACGRQLVALGRKDEARARFEAALKLDPDHEGARKALAGLDAPAGTKG